MEFLDKDEIQKILNLKGSDLIQPVIAERQIEVIRKGFNFLHQLENNALYIADEVGLGKTYIALGIASLMRHFSSNPESYQDVIVVPKENLQQKWAKEIRQFIRNNYKQQDNVVKSVIGQPVGKIQTLNFLEAINTDIPGYHIYRNSSFSFGLAYNSQKSIRDSLLSRLKDPISIGLFNKAEKLGYLYSSNKILLKRFYAYLLSINFPPIELLIVDEGHWFKQGLGNTDNDEVSDRNNVATRFFGIKRNADEDKNIFEDFPELKKLVQPKVEKLLILSATPKTNSLLELKKQFDCFLPNHILSEAKTEKQVEEKLNHFLIRGKMEYELNGESFSRNQCRLEHRKGNDEKKKDALGLSLQDNEQALVIGLLQYNTIKHLNAKNNAYFELGMLAGFETFKLDQQKKTIDEQEFEETRTNKIRTSQDEEILSAIIDSYKEEFGVLPPHPKQDAIVDAIFHQMKNGEKSLVFVRRVASAYELERRLLDRWEKEVVYKDLHSKWKTVMKSSELDSLISTYEGYEKNRSVNEKLENIFDGLISRFILSSKTYPISDNAGNSYSGENLKTGLYYVFNNYKNLVKGQEFYDLIVKQVSLDNYKSEFLQLAYQLILESKSNWAKLLGKEDESPFDEEEDDSYFFHNYFRQPSNKYFRKSRIYQADWFDLNYFLLNNHFKIAAFELESLKKKNIHAKAKDASDIKEVQEIFLKYIKDEEFQDFEISEDDFPSALVSKNTLITELLIKVFESEFRNFLRRIELKNNRKIELIREIKTLVTILKSTIRNGIGFLPLYIADNAKGDISKNYIKMITTEGSCFNHVVTEIKSIINDYELLQAVNFPEKDNQREIESKLIYQSPVKGMSGIKNNKGKVAAQFRMPGYPFVLVTTDIFREGEDLHTYCQNIYHYGIAWNCSDMEQRTGRIDRINSLSNRKMVLKQNNDFFERIHVFYPYLQKTLEVNQVNKLFKSINQFNRAFDIIDSIEEDGIASVKEAIEEMPAEIDSYMKSKFEHINFKGYEENGRSMSINNMVGSSLDAIKNCLVNISEKTKSSGVFHLVPELIFEDFKIIGDYNLVNRNNRRGPFQILVKNDIVPGQFLLEMSCYLFKASSKIQRAYKEASTKKLINYKMIEIDDFHAFSLNYKLNDLDEDKFIEELIKMVNIADEWEEQITLGHDTVVFG